MWNHNNFSQLCSTYGHHWNYKFTNDSWKNKCFPSTSWRVLNISQTKLNTITVFHLVTQHSRSLGDNCTRTAQQQQTTRKKILTENFVRNKALDTWISPSTPAPVSPKPSAFWVSQFDCVFKENVSKRENTTTKFMFKIMICKTNKPYFYNCLSALKELSNVPKKGPPNLPSNDRTCRHPAGKHWYITSEFKRSSSTMIKLSSRQIHESSIDFSLHSHYFLWKVELTQEVQKKLKRVSKTVKKNKTSSTGSWSKTRKNNPSIKLLLPENYN